MWEVARTAVEGVVAAAQGVGSILPELVGPAAAEDMDAQLAELLTHAGAGSDIAEQLQTVLQQRQEKAAFLKAVVADAPEYRPPQVRPQ